LLIFEHAIFRPVTRHMERADAANSPVSYWRSLGTSCHPLLLIAQVAFGIVMAGGFVFAFTLQRSWILLTGGVLAVGTMLLPTLVALYSWWTSRAA
jgi:hypothetical protein